MTKDWVHGVDHSPVCQILLQMVVRVVITSSPPAWTSSTGMLSTPADFPFFGDCTAASTSVRRMGWSSTVSVWEPFSTDWSPLALWLYSSEQYLCPSAQYFLFFCKAFSWKILDSSSFFLFHSGEVFRELVRPLAVVLPQIFSSLTALISHSVFSCLFQALLDAVVHSSVFLRYFSFESFLSQFSPCE